MKKEFALLIDHLYWNNDILTWELLSEIKKQMNPHDLMMGIDSFLLNLKPDHELPGNDWYKLQGIANWIREENPLTPKQFNYSILTITSNWRQRNTQLEQLLL